MGLLLAPFAGTSVDSLWLISSNTTDAPIDSAFTCSSGALTGAGTNASFAVGQLVYIHQTQGTGAGTQMYNVISSYSSGTIGFYIPLNATYTTGAQILVVKQYSQITINGSCTLSAKAWNGTVGGILALMASGRIINNGAISGNALGFRGGVGGVGVATGTPGESSLGTAIGSNSANGSGGGGGDNLGGNGLGGSVIGVADLSTIFPGAGGGGANVSSGGALDGGAGGAIINIICDQLVNAGAITSNGGNSNAGTRASGPGAGGSINIFTRRGTFGSGLITALAGTPGSASANAGGNGGGAGHTNVGTAATNSASGSSSDGRISIGMCQNVDGGTTNPAFNNKGYQTYCGIIGRG